MIDELKGFRAQLHPREADGQPIRLYTGNGEAEQMTRNLRAVLWDAAVRIKALDADLAAARAEVEAKDRRIAALAAEAKAVDDALSKQTFDEWEGLDHQQMAAVIAADMRHIVTSARRRAARTVGGSDAG